MHAIRKPPALLLLASLFAGAPAAEALAEEVAAPKPARPVAASPHDPALPADMEAALRKAGFSDLEIMPNSIFVRAKDKAGHPVAMVLDPRSMTEMVTLDPHSGPSAGGNGAPTMTGSATFVTVLPTEKLSSALIGIKVADRAGAALGTIKDIAIDHGGVHAYILQVGGLFGIGERYVAVTPTALVLTFDAEARTYRATMDASAEQIRTAPTFRYEDVTEAKRN